MEPLDINFDSSALYVMNAMMACVIFGVTLTLKVDDFKRVIRQPRAPITGLVAQFFLFPAITTFIIWLFAIPPELGLGMILLSSCPGGSISNILTYLSRGNVAVSVSMTAVSSVGAIVMTPFNFAFYAALNPSTRAILQDIVIDPVSLLGLFFLILGIPLALGMYLGSKFPEFARKVERPFRVISMTVMLGFVIVACANNLESMLKYIGIIAVTVIGLNTLALLIGYGAGKLTGLPEADRRAVTMEVGIQNSGLGFSILFTFYPEMTAMIQVVGLWGVWHLVSGMALTWFWSRRASGQKENERNFQALEADGAREPG
ncbi:bile acid:sodium symporter family protein [Endozoicomonas arenosclerae]|uniref:bile acid:sodium symporter family protein n=1 Tax=Endozoicomonas arenosclerae TaxID=1633495 RepID=UPI0007807852|nr:bile acid:sodium symporter family protein [Endozoicomonas arenosclerae]